MLPRAQADRRLARRPRQLLRQPDGDRLASGPPSNSTASRSTTRRSPTATSWSRRGFGLQLRLGCNQRSETQFRGGLGVFNGSNPAVWISNSFSNDGTLLERRLGQRARRRRPGHAGHPAPRPDRVPRRRRQPVHRAEDFGLSQGSAEINLTDPELRLADHFPDQPGRRPAAPRGLRRDGLEGLYSNTINGVQWQSLNREPFAANASTVDGRGFPNASTSSRSSELYPPAGDLARLPGRDRADQHRRGVRLQPHRLSCASRPARALMPGPLGQPGLHLQPGQGHQLGHVEPGALQRARPGGGP